MYATQRQRGFQVLCHEHHVKMNFSEVQGGSAVEIEYACTEPDCCVRYNSARGYFVPSQNNMDMLMFPKVRCSRDGTPMYLAETDRVKRGFRLWACPQCDARHTNEESLVGESHEMGADVARNDLDRPR